MRKIVFLDFDGVLNYSDFIQSRVKPKHMSDYAGWKKFHEGLDPGNVENLNRIIEETGAEIIISSSWRILYTVKQLKIILKSNGFRFPEKIVGRTDSLGGDKRRGDEIKKWLIDHRCEDAVFVIIDDDSDMGDLIERLVQTKWFGKGLESHHANQAIRMLNEEGLSWPE